MGGLPYEGVVENLEVRDVEQASLMKGMENFSSCRSSTGAATGRTPWADLDPDLLAEVFSRIPFVERITTLPVVCKAWKEATSYSACWRYLDLEDWFQMRSKNDFVWTFGCEPTVEKVIMKAVDMSCGQLREIRAMYCSDAAVHYVADRCRSLTVFAIPYSFHAEDASIIKLAENCPDLRELDLSDCYTITQEALEAVGRHCKSLVWLGRNMVENDLVMDLDFTFEVVLPVPGADDEAVVVAKHMGNLKHLEMKRTALSDRGLAHLARGCVRLESLNLACCTKITPRAVEIVTEKCPNIVDFTKPITPRMHVSLTMITAGENFFPVF